MKEKIKGLIKLTGKYKWFLLVILIICGAFYWYEWRPSQARKECYQRIIDIQNEKYKDQEKSIDEWNEIGDFVYKNCLRKRGF